MSSSTPQHEALFAAMISGYTTQALVALGKMANPITGKQERDLDQARALIGMLEMIEAKTEGNRSEEESSAIRQSISTLRLNYVEELNKPSSEEETGKDRDTSDPSEKSEEQAPPGSSETRDGSTGGGD
jgi:hypothetical protein